MERSRASLSLRITRAIIAHHPHAFKAEELALAFGEPKRKIQRVIADMLEAELIEKHYTAYRLRTDLVTQLYGARWFHKTELEKYQWLEKKQNRS